MNAEHSFEQDALGGNVELRLKRIEQQLRENSVAVSEQSQHPRFIFFAAASCGSQRATVVSSSGADFDGAWKSCCEKLAIVLRQINNPNVWLRVDYVVEIKEVSYLEFKSILQSTKRNYFRLGIAFDPAFEIAFTEQELNANAMLYGGNTIENAIINPGNFKKYAAIRDHAIELDDLRDDSSVYLFRTSGFFIGGDGHLHQILSGGRDSGRRYIASQDADNFLHIIKNSSSFLARQVNNDGRFTYGYHPCFDREIATYNVLRHASTTYSMVEAWAQTRDEALKAAIDRSLHYLNTNCIQKVVLQNGLVAAYLVEENGEIKLGGNAVALLALTAYMTETGSLDYIDLADSLAHGICSMQSTEDGSFTHVLNATDISVKEKFRTIYYDGEASFALMRLYMLTKNEQLLEAVERAFDYFIAERHWRHHDHWLAYCVNELIKIRSSERYFRFALNNIDGYLDFVENRITTFPTLLELMMATQSVLFRISESTEHQSMLSEVDLARFGRAMDARAHHLLNGYFWPETAMFFANPNRILNSFYIRHQAFRVRIDDVEHYLSGLIAYCHHLKNRGKFQNLVMTQRLLRLTPRAKGNFADMSISSTGWDKYSVIKATGGTWIREPTEDWSAPALCTYLPAMRDGAIAVLRKDVGEVGIAPHQHTHVNNAGALMLTDPALIADNGIPTLQVDDTKEAVLKMGRYGRNQMSGKVIGVTGSAGKTTMVALINHILSTFGSVSATQDNANLPIGVAWNLASMPWNSDFVALELAIGRMAISANMARPHIAVFTNVLPAHLGKSSTLADIAETKSAIFTGMRPGDTAILYRDMLEWDKVYEAALRRKLRILTYGMRPDCDFRLAAFDSGSQHVYALAEGREVIYRIGAGGQHNAINSLAVLAVLSALDLPIEVGVKAFASFVSLPGRGETLELKIDGKSIKLIDDAYNANPGSMRAALDHLSNIPAERRLAILGEMADLGDEAGFYHKELSALINDSNISKVYAVGPLYADFWDLLHPSKRGLHLIDRLSLMELLRKDLLDDDVILVKGSNRTQMHMTVKELKNAAVLPQ